MRRVILMLVIVFGLRGIVFSDLVDNMLREARMGTVNPLSQPRYSPDGKYILFNGQLNDGKNMYLMDAETKRVLKRLKKEELSSFFSYTPDGKFIVFKKGSGFLIFSWDQLWIMNSDGTGKRLINNLRNEIFMPISVADNKIYYVIETKNLKEQIGSIDINGSNEMIVVTNSYERIYSMVNLPGNKIVFTASPLGSWAWDPLYTYEFDLSNHTTREIVGPSKGIKEGLLVYSYNYSNEIMIYDQGEKFLKKVDLKSGKITPVAKLNINGWYFTDFCLSPDGKKIVFLRAIRTGSYSARYTMAEMDIKSGKAEVIVIPEEDLKNAPYSGD